MCNYSNIFIIGRWKSLKVHIAVIGGWVGVETYRLIGRKKLVASLNLMVAFVLLDDFPALI
jgi:hypothetical protein